MVAMLVSTVLVSKFLANYLFLGAFLCLLADEVDDINLLLFCSNSLLMEFGILFCEGKHGEVFNKFEYVKADIAVKVTS